MEKKNLLVRIFVPVVVAGMVFVGLPACFQDDGYPEGFVLNDEAGVATMVKRSMPQGGESIKPIEPEKPSYKYGEATVTFKCTNALPSEYIDGYTVLTMTVHYSYRMENGEPTSVEYVYSAEDNPEFSIDDIDLVIPHQANQRIIQSARKRLGLDESRVFSNVEQFGNMSAACIPVALCQAIEEGRIKKGQKLVIVSMGGGLTWGSVLIEL